MRFSAVHKVSSYLMVTAAFAAVALPGDLTLPWLLFTLVGGATSFFFEPATAPFAHRPLWAQAWNALTLGAFVWSAVDALRGETLILSGVHFLCVLLVNKLWNRRTSKDYLQAYVVSFLMLVAGTILNTEIAYAFCFVAYVTFATWTLTLFHLRREMEENYLIKHSDDAQSERVEVERILNSRRVVGGSFLAGTSLVSLGVFVASSVIFFSFPRIGFGFFWRPPRPALRVGFNDRGVELGQNGIIRDNEQVVMRVELPGGPPRQPLYFRGIAFESYQRSADGKTASWLPDPRRQRGALKSVAEVALAPSWRGRPLEGRDARRRLDESLVQTIYLEPMGDVSVLFAAEAPLGVRLRSSNGLPSADLGADGDELGNFYTGSRRSGLKYTAYSIVTPAAEEELRAAPDVPTELPRELRAEIGPSRELPPDFSPRVLALARSLTSDAPGPFAKALAIQRYLAQNYRYTTQLGRDTRYDPLEDFLFVQKRGHCEYFASALALMLRAVGVPARHVAGFMGGEWNEYGKYLRVRQRDAHAWVEAYMGDVGWVLFDPTPPVVAGRSGGSSLGDRVRKLIDLVELAWFNDVIEYDLGKQVDALRGLRHWFRGRPAHRTASTRPIIDWAKRHRLALVAAALAVALAVRLRRQRVRAMLPGYHRPSRALQALERAARALERRGLAQRLGETAAELGKRATAKGDPGARPFCELVDLYYAARFGDRTIDRATLEQLASRVVKPEEAPPP